MNPPTYMDEPCTAVAGPFTMFTDSTELKSRGRPLPLLVMRERSPLRNRSADWPRMLAFEGAPKLVVVNALEVNFEKSLTSLMLISVRCWRDIIVTLRGTSTMLSSVPKTELKGREVGRICWLMGTSLTSNFSIWTAVSEGGASDAGVWALAVSAQTPLTNARSLKGC